MSADVPAAVQHVCNSLTLYSRFCDEGLSHGQARHWSNKIESILHPHLYPARQRCEAQE